MARPTKFSDALKEKMLALYADGKTDVQVAKIIGVSPRTINNWKGSRPEFLQSLRESKSIADELVEASLFGRAVGYSHPSEKIFCDKDGGIHRAKYTEHYAPDVSAQKFWLMNRQPKRWREQIDLKVSKLSKMSDEELNAKYEAILAKISEDKTKE